MNLNDVSVGHMLYIDKRWVNVDSVYHGNGDKLIVCGGTSYWLRNLKMAGVKAGAPRAPCRGAVQSSEKGSVVRNKLYQNNQAAQSKARIVELELLLIDADKANKGQSVASYQLVATQYQTEAAVSKEQFKSETAIASFKYSAIQTMVRWSFALATSASALYFIS